MKSKEVKSEKIKKKKEKEEGKGSAVVRRGWSMAPKASCNLRSPRFKTLSWYFEVTPIKFLPIIT